MKRLKPKMFSDCCFILSDIPTMSVALSPKPTCSYWRHKKGSNKKQNKAQSFPQTDGHYIKRYSHGSKKCICALLSAAVVMWHWLKINYGAPHGNNMWSDATVWLTDGFLVVFGQQWSSVPLGFNSGDNSGLIGDIKIWLQAIVGLGNFIGFIDLKFKKKVRKM